MHNPAPTEHPVHEVIQNRWSPRAFGDKTIPADVLRSLFEAARWAPSSNNQQPWAYIVATKDDKENFDKILSVLVAFNAGWAKEASALAIAVAELKFANGNPNRNAYYDVGAASLQLSIEATTRGLVVHQMAGYDHEKARQVFHIPADWDAIAVIAIGHPGDPKSLPAPLNEREVAPRSRKPLSSFVMTGKWGHTAPFITK
jgi:nitroreductase